MIYITGDIHHMSMHTSDQKYMDCTEVEAAITMAKIASLSNIKLSFFITGKAVTEEIEKVKELNSFDNVELGGHNYYAFKPKWLYSGLFSKILGNVNGPDIWQNFEIRKTINTIHSKIGVKITTWRDHAYKCNNSTNQLLANNNISVVSNIVDPSFLSPEKDFKTNMNILGINIWPDHDHIIHGDQAYKSGKAVCLQRSKFPARYFTIHQWSSKVKKDIEGLLSNNNTPVLLIHPGCMNVADNFKSFTEICEFIHDINEITMFASEARL